MRICEKRLGLSTWAKFALTGSLKIYLFVIKTLSDRDCPRTFNFKHFYAEDGPGSPTGDCSPRSVSLKSCIRLRLAPLTCKLTHKFRLFDISKICLRQRSFKPIQFRRGLEKIHPMIESQWQGAWKWLFLKTKWPGDLIRIKRLVPNLNDPPSDADCLIAT